MIDLDGASFGERFAGQTLSASGNSDTLSGAPIGGGLTLLAGAAGENLNIFDRAPDGNASQALGRWASRTLTPFGEGAVTILFDNDQSEFGFQSVGGNLGAATFDFWGRDGSLLGSISPLGLGTDFFGFMSDSQNIASISI